MSLLLLKLPKVHLTVLFQYFQYLISQIHIQRTFINMFSNAAGFKGLQGLISKYNTPPYWFPIASQQFMCNAPSSDDNVEHVGRNPMV